MRSLHERQLLVCAWSLVAIDLVEGTSRRDERDESAIGRQLSHGPPYLDVRAAADAVTEAFQQDPTRAMRLARLAKELITLNARQPSIKPRSASPLLWGLLDLDLLAIHALVTKRSPCSRPSPMWFPPVLPPQVRNREALFAEPMAELHVHLGGAVCAGIVWNRVLRGQLSIDQALDLKDDDEGARWRERLDLALAELGFDPHQTGSSDAPGGAGGLIAFLEPERQWLFDHVARVVRDADADADADRLWAYLGLKAAFSRRLLLVSGGRGLGRFQEALTRQRRSRISDRDTTGWVLESYLLDLPRAAFVTAQDRIATPLDVELRVQLPPPSDRKRLHDWLWGIRDLLRRWDAPLRVGLIHQISKTRSQGPDPNDMVRQIEEFLDVLIENPGLRRFMIGIDGAGDELAAPPRQFAAAFRELVHRLDQADVPDDPVLHLGITYHVGEDFRDLLTGLRHVEEAARLLHLRRGDRLGHALALFWDPDVYYGTSLGARAHRDLAPTVADHALDLLWLVYQLERRPGCFERAAWARARLLDHLRTQGIKEPGKAVHQALGHLQNPVDLFSEAELLDVMALGVPGRKRSCGVVHDDRWLDALTVAQAIAWEAVRDRELYVEVNPTSNFLVGGFSRYHELPYVRRLHRTGGDLLDEVALVVGTDDPGIFHTTLTHEYVALGEALVALGTPPPRAVRILDRLRQNGRRATFLPAALPSGRDLADLIERYLEGRP